MRIKKCKNPFMIKAYHNCHHFLHLVYFGAVMVEGVGYYAAAAGGLLGLTILAYFINEED